MRFAAPSTFRKEAKIKERAPAEDITDMLGYAAISPLAGILLWNIVTSLAG